MLITLLGCGGRLEVKGGDDDDDDDDDDDSRHGKDVCKSNNWTPPLINFQKTSDPKIKFCRVKPKDTEWCNIQTAHYVAGYDRWRNFTNVQQRFWTSKKKKDVYLKVISERNNNDYCLIRWPTNATAKHCQTSTLISRWTDEACFLRQFHGGGD